MPDFSSMQLGELLKVGGHACSCGRVHASGLEFLKICAGAIDMLPEALEVIRCRKPFVVCDRNTKAAAWDRVQAVLEKGGIPYVLYCLNTEHAEPDEHTVGSLLMAFDPSCDCVLGIGSGVINDSCKVLAHAARFPSLIVATAPSMDGYASNSSSMVRDGVKVTLYNACPRAVIADTDIIKNAPERMLWAGLGDMLAKYVSICEWRISNLVTGEFYCENIAGLVRASLKRIVDAAPKLMERDPGTIEAVVEGLVLSGVAMAFAESSRPASGLEHYFSHMWEMMALDRGLPYDLHGIQVGVGTRLTLRICDRIRTLTPSREQAEEAMRNFSQERWEASVRENFGSAAVTVLDMEQKVRKNDPVKHRKRLDAILSHWEGIQSIISQELPETKTIEQLMRSVHMPMTPRDIGISDCDVVSAFIGSRDIRDKYLVSSMLWDLGILDGFLDSGILNS